MECSSECFFALVFEFVLLDLNHPVRSPFFKLTTWYAYDLCQLDTFPLNLTTLALSAFQYRVAPFGFQIVLRSQLVRRDTGSPVSL